MDLLATIELFIDVTRTGSFTETARRRHLSASAVNRRIKQLEDHLGVELIQRTTRHHTLTQAGSVYLAHAERIVGDVDSARTAVTAMESQPTGVLRVTAPVVFGQQHVSESVQRFLNGHPGLEAELTLTDRMVDLHQEPVDIAIRIAKLEDSSLKARQLLSMTRVLCASPRYLKQAGTPESPVELVQHECVIFSPDSIVSPASEHRKAWEFQRGDAIEKVWVNGRYRSNNASAIVGATKNDFGIALVPVWLVLRELESGQLQTLLSEYRVSPSGLQTGVHAMYVGSRHLSPRVRVFLDFLIEHFQRIQNRVDVVVS